MSGARIDVRRIALLLASLAALGMITAGVVTGGAAMLLAPRVWPRTVIGVAALALLAAVEAVAGTRSPGPATALRLWPLLVPLALVPAALAGSSTDQATIRLFTAAGTLSSVDRPVITPLPAPDDDPSWVGEANPALVEAAAGLQDESPFGERDDSRRAQEVELLVDRPGPIVIDDASFAERIDLIWDYPRQFAGREIELTVFAYRENSWPVEEFAAARLSIWCCAADAAVVGLLVEANRATAPPTGTWMRLSGTLGVRDSFDSGSLAMADLPVVREATWHPVDAPAMEYVFPPAW